MNLSIPVGNASFWKLVINHQSPSSGKSEASQRFKLFIFTLISSKAVKAYQMRTKLRGWFVWNSSTIRLPSMLSVYLLHDWSITVTWTVKTWNNPEYWFAFHFLSNGSFRLYPHFNFQGIHRLTNKITEYQIPWWRTLPEYCWDFYRRRRNSSFSFVNYVPAQWYSGGLSNSGQGLQGTKVGNWIVNCTMKILPDMSLIPAW